MTDFSVDLGAGTVDIDGVTFDMSVADELELAKLTMMNKLVRVLERLRRG